MNFDETKSPSITCQVKILVHGLHTDTFVLIYTYSISPDRFMSDTVILNFSSTVHVCIGFNISKNALKKARI